MKNITQEQIQTVQIIKADISAQLLKMLHKNHIDYDQTTENNDPDRQFDSRLIALKEDANRQIAALPRKVYYSKELVSKIETSKKAEKPLIDCIRAEFEKGEDMNRYLSKSRKHSSKYDSLLNCWRIKHLHLEKAAKNLPDKGAVKGTNDLLFCIITDQAAYFLDARAHPHGATFFSIDFLNIIINNHWETFAQLYELRGVTGLSVEVSSPEDIYGLYKNHINTAFHLGDKCYMPGIGISAVGCTLEETNYINRVNNQIALIVIRPGFEYRGFELRYTDCLGELHFSINEKAYRTKIG